MIITRSWLEEFLNLKNISNETIINKLNNIGLEVSNYHHYNFSKKIVLGRIIDIVEHSTVENLYICKVDIGNEILQIISSASNLLNINYVAVAKIDAQINNSIVEESIIHGEINSGIICSNKELGLPNLYKGILILDDSIGKLILGKQINNYSTISDTIIDIDLTANRRDCASIYGIARELSAGLNIPLNSHFLSLDYKNNILGLSRFLKISKNNNSKISVQYVIANMRLSYLPLLCKLRLSFIKQTKLESLDSVITYISHSVGIFLKAYDISMIQEDNIDINISINKKYKTNEILLNNRKVSTVGFTQDLFSKAKRLSSRVLFEASYIDPKYIKNSIINNNLKIDNFYYQSSRGTNPNIKLGIEYLKFFFEKYVQSDFYTGIVKYENKEPVKILQINSLDISKIIGEDISLLDISQILRTLSFITNNISSHELRVEVPSFRHDIENTQNIAEEIIRMRGIYNIKEKSFNFASKNMTNNYVNNFYKQNDFINKIITLGFYENISYIFTNKELQKKYDLPMVKEELDIINPISNNFNTLRTSIILNLLLAVSYNRKHSRSSIGFFEIGIIYDENRVEQKVISLIFSGGEESNNIFNQGKSKNISIEHFSKKISSIIPNLKFKKNKTLLNKFIHPFESADIIIDDLVVGYISKLSKFVQDDFKIETTFILEMDYNSIFKKKKIDINFSKFSIIYKDLSIIIDNNIESIEIIDKIKGFDSNYLKNIYPIDVYTDENLNNRKSLTLRFEIQSLNKILEDQDIISLIDEIVTKLQNIYSIEIKSK